MPTRAPSLRWRARGSTIPSAWWGAFALAGCAASLAPVSWQLGFAAAAIGLLGLPHGASDLAIVPAARRPVFLLCYGATITAMAFLWLRAPTAGLALLLITSALHFALDGGDETEPAVEWPVAALLVAGPALLHRAALADLFATLDVATPAAFVAVLHATAIVALAALALAVAVGRRSPVMPMPLLAAGVASVALLPPLVGFATGFVLLHARPQTIARGRLLGAETLVRHLRAIMPVLVGAAATLALVALPFAGGHAAGPRTLFAAILALAMPHMVVTPLWRRRVARAAPPPYLRLWPAPENGCRTRL